jgi:hypothetical protein
MLKALREFDVFSIPFGFFIKRKSGKDGTKKTYHNSYKSALGAVLSMCLVAISCIFLGLLIVRMYQCNDDDVSSFRLFNDFTIFDEVDLEEINFMPNLRMTIKNDADEDQLRSLGIIHEHEEDGKLRYDLNVLS